MKRRNLFPLLVAGALFGCATTLEPSRFELVDEQSKVWAGTYDTATQSLNVSLPDGVYSGFYIVASDTVTTMAFPTSFYRRAWPVETRGTITSNLARAHLRNDAGGHLACEILLEGTRALGGCKTPSGKLFQFVAGR